MAPDQKQPRRGRPRPQETINRDQAILTFLSLNGPHTRNALAEIMELSPTKTWLALDRLRRAGLVRKCPGEGTGNMLWTAEVKRPCP